MNNQITFDRVVRWVITGLVITAVYLILHQLSSVLLPFFIAWLAAYLLYPCVKFVQYKLRVRIRAIAILITMLATIAVLGAVVWFIVPPMLAQIGTLERFISQYVSEQTQSADLLSWIRDVLQQNRTEIETYLQSNDFQSFLQTAIPRVFSFVGRTADLLISIIASFIVLLYMFFILLDYEYLTENWVRMFPQKYRSFWTEVMIDVEKALHSYIRGQGLVALFVSILFCIGLTIIDFPIAIGLGIFIGILNIVPYLQTIAILPTAFLSLLKAADTGENFWVIFGSAMLVFAVVQIIQEAILVPRIMGKAMGLNPAVLLLSLSVWGSLLGFMGLILALPLTTLIFVYLKRYVTKESTPVLSEQENLENTTESTE